MYTDDYTGGSIGQDLIIGTYPNGHSNQLYLSTTGNVGIGTNNPSQRLQVNGNICYTGSIAACSDIRYKKDISPIKNALTSVVRLNGIYYKWDREKFAEKAFGDETQIGFSAQEVETLFPEMVQTDVQGYKALDYSRLTPVLVEAIKEQQKQIDDLKKQVKFLMEKFNKE